ncbi:EXS_family protein [Hexamita inflata]|uniref:EXS family protein n=1 Tax=Hexamita inflata TaxID=28002 RepID=A0AA86QYL0_9EUKA|nr:EXS family protein [Hexamita inflata]
MQQNQDEIIAEWISKYVDSEYLNKLIFKVQHIVEAQKKNKKTQEYNDVLLIQMFNEIENQFWTKISDEIAKVEEFYNKEVQGASKRVNEIREVVFNNTSDPQTVSIIEENITETYRGLDLLSNYCNQNASQLRKLARSWTVNSNIQIEAQIIENKLQKVGFADPELIPLLKERLESCLALLLDVSKKEAIDQLNKLYSDNHAQKKSQSQLLSGFLCALAVIFCITFYVMMFDIPTRLNMKLKILPSTMQLLRIQIQCAFILIGYGTLVRACVHTHINYIYLFEIPSSKTVTTSAQIVGIGAGVLLLSTFFGTMAASSALGPNYPIPIPFGDHLAKVAFKIDPNLWVLFTTFIHLVVAYYMVVGIFAGKCPGMKHLFTTVYKTLTPWAHPVGLTNFFLGTHFTAWGLIIKDFARIVTRQKITDDWLCFLAGISCLIRVVQCIKKFIPKKEWYPQMTGAALNAAVFIGFFLHQKSLITSHNATFWFLFVWRCVETVCKLYWDFCEDGGLFFGGFGGRIFKQKSSKWQYGKLCRRPSFIPKSWIYFFLVYDTISRWLFSFAALWPHNKVFSHYLWALFTGINEIERRFCWALFRLDNQQATNCESYMATRYIPVLVNQEETLKIQNQVAHVTNPVEHKTLQPSCTNVFVGEHKSITALKTQVDSTMITTEESTIAKGDVLMIANFASQEEPPV